MPPPSIPAPGRCGGPEGMPSSRLLANLPSFAVWRRYFGRNLTGVGLLLLLAYFLWSSLHGERGLLAWIDLQRSLEASRVELSRLEDRHTALVARIDALDPAGIDPDVLTEELHRLGYVAPDEVIVLTPEDGAGDP